MRFIVFECRKCGHNIYVENTEDLAKSIRTVSNLDCPICGEEPEGNWALVGLRNKYPYDENKGE